MADFIQIPIKIFTSLSEYSKKIKAGNFPLQDFSKKCPICHGTDCAVRIGYYYRLAYEFTVDGRSVISLQIPVARLLCRQKQKPKRAHRTFSLLPDILIPYNRISIDLFMFIMQFIFDNTLTTEQKLEKIDEYSSDAGMMSEKTLMRILTIFEQTRIKLNLFFKRFTDTDRAPPDFTKCTIKETTGETFDFLLQYPKPGIKSPYCAAYYLSQKYYEQSGSYRNNAHFLFGTASQFLQMDRK